MASSPFFTYGDTVNTVLNLARSRVDDLVLPPQNYPGGSDPGMQFTEAGGGIQSVELNSSGSLILRTQIIFNGAWRKFQTYIANFGFRLTVGDGLIIASLPATGNGDPTVQNWISWNGFYNGSVLSGAPALPSDLFSVIRVWERPHGTGQFTPMMNAVNGIVRGITQAGLNRQYEWRQNALWLPGTTAATDIQLRYVRYFPNFPDPNQSGEWYTHIVPIPYSTSSLAWFVAAEALLLRADDQTAAGGNLALQNGKEEADAIFNNQARSDQRTRQINESFGRPGGQGTTPDAQGGR